MKRPHQFGVEVCTASLSLSLFLAQCASQRRYIRLKGFQWGRGAPLNNEVPPAQLLSIMAAFILTRRKCVYFMCASVDVCICVCRSLCISVGEAVLELFFFYFLLSSVLSSFCWFCKQSEVWWGRSPLECGESVRWCRLTELAHFENLTQHLGQLDAAAAKWTLMFVFSTAVLQDDLETQAVK